MLGVTLRTLASPRRTIIALECGVAGSVYWQAVEYGFGAFWKATVVLIDVCPR